MYALIDELYEGFLAALPDILVPTARDLAYTLGLTPRPGIPWSQVFGHSITLAAPALLAEAMPGLPERALGQAVKAHGLAVIEAFGTDRIQDGQVHATPVLHGVLGHLRRARDEALAGVAPAVEDPSLDYARAERDVLDGIRLERVVLLHGEPVGLRTYEALSGRKQRVGLPAGIALAWAAGWDRARRIMVARMLESAALGLQLHDDVVDWEKDLAQGGAWAVALTRGIHPVGAGLEARAIARVVHSSGTLSLMLRRSRWHFRACHRRARALGARSLARWAQTQEDAMGELAAQEARSPGYTLRARVLAGWAQEVLHAS